MPDSYLAISQIATDHFMTERVRSCVAQQEASGTIVFIDGETVESWVYVRRYQWASSPTWGEKWDYANETHPEEEYQPGADPAVITDADILSTVQALAEAA